MSEKRFTVSEVNALVPRLAQAVRLIQEGHARMSALSRTLFKGGSPAPESSVDPVYLTSFNLMLKGVQAISEMGGDIKDMGSGLVDFRSCLKGRDVFLCWRPGEGRILFWHEIDAGFQGRSSIGNEDEFEGDPGEDGASDAPG